MRNCKCVCMRERERMCLRERDREFVREGTDSKSLFRVAASMCR